MLQKKPMIPWVKAELTERKIENENDASPNTENRALLCKAKGGNGASFKPVACMSKESDSFVSSRDNQL